MSEITSHAKKLGFSKAMLIDPTAHPSYFEPYLFSLFDAKTKEIHRRIAFGEASKEEKEEYKQKKKEVILLHQTRMKKLYTNVAKGEGFVKKGNYFVKNLKEAKN